MDQQADIIKLFGVTIYGLVFKCFMIDIKSFQNDIFVINVCVAQRQRENKFLFISPSREISRT